MVPGLLNQRGSGCRGVVPRSLIKERNARLPVYITSDLSGPLAVSQQRLRALYPAIHNDLRNSGNRLINPVDFLSPFFGSLNDRGRCAEAAELIKSTLRNDTCPACQVDPIIESRLRNLKEAAHLGDPFLWQDELQEALDLFRAFGGMQGGLGRPDSLATRLYPCHQHGSFGLSPSVYALMQENSLRFLPVICSFGGPEDVFEFLESWFEMTGKDIAFLIRALEDLRIDEKVDLYQVSLGMCLIHGSSVGETIAVLLEMGY